MREESKAIEKFKDKKDRLITYEELEKIPLNQMIQIVPELPGAIEVIRITSTSENTLMFTVTMKPNQLWEKHHHDCFETCAIFKGRLTDAVTGKSAGIAESMTFQPYEPHYVVSEENTIFYVEFKKPMIK